MEVARLEREAWLENKGNNLKGILPLTFHLDPRHNKGE